MTTTPASAAVVRRARTLAGPDVATCAECPREIRDPGDDGSLGQVFVAATAPPEES